MDVFSVGFPCLKKICRNKKKNNQIKVKLLLMLVEFLQWKYNHALWTEMLLKKVFKNVSYHCF